PALCAGALISAAPLRASVLDADFAEMLAARQKVESGMQFLESKHSADRRVNLVQGDCPGHLGKIIAIADSDSLQPDMPGHDLSQRYVQGCARKHANHAYCPPGPNGAKRLCHRELTAHFNHVVNTFSTRSFTCVFAPFRDIIIVDRFVSTHRPRSRQLLIAG